MSIKKDRNLADAVRAIIDRWEPKVPDTSTGSHAATILGELESVLSDIGGVLVRDLSESEKWRAVGAWALVYSPIGADPEGAYYEAIILGYQNRDGRGGMVGNRVSLLRPAPSVGGFSTSEASAHKVVLAPDGRRAWTPDGSSISPVPPGGTRQADVDVTVHATGIEDQETFEGLCRAIAARPHGPEALR